MDVITNTINTNTPNNTTNTTNTINTTNTTNTYNTTNNNIKSNEKNDMYCSNCGHDDHLFKNCGDPVNSYGLLCFYKKKAMVKDTISELHNKRTKTKKNEFSLKNKNNNKYNKNINNLTNLNKIKILKRHETISQTLKNMIGIVGSTNPCETNNIVTDSIDETNYIHDEIDAIDGIGSIIDIDEIIDMDDDTETENNSQTNSQTNFQTNSQTNSPIQIQKQQNNNFISNQNQNQKLKEITIQKVVLVQRRNTIGLIEFIRGKYELNNPNYIIKLFNMMTFDEKRMFREYDSFDMLRTLIGLKREFNYRGEYTDAKTKFNTLRDDPRGNQIHMLLDKSYTKWNSPEWGAPKGRRNNKEYDIECAIREFVEETGIKYRNINVYRNIKPLEEIYKGVNGVVYKHTYFIADIKDTIESHENITYIEKGGYLNSEVSNVKCFNLTECQKIIRPYYLSKLNVIKKGFQIIHCMNNYFE